MKNEEIINEMEEMVVKDLNTNYLTLNEISRNFGYEDVSYLSRKVKKLKLGFKIKTIILLSEEDQEILKKSIKRRGSKFSSE